MTASNALTSSTYSADDEQQVGRVYDLITAEEISNPSPQYFLVGSHADTDPVELPKEIYQVLREVVEAMKKGLSVTISPTSQTLTTQQAADLLGISRPTLVKALDNEKLPYTRVGTHRRIALTDVLDYREKRREEQYAALEALSADVNESSDIDHTLSELRKARKAVSARRRNK